MPLYRADQLFEIIEGKHELGMPSWANLTIKPKQGVPGDFRGPGLYGVLFNGSLIYVGLYSGVNSNPFGGSVLDRWGKHVLGQTLRARSLFFSKGPLDKILFLLRGEPADGLAKALGIPPGIVRKLNDLSSSPLLRQRGILSGFNKACFATQHWNVVGPGNEKGLLGHFTFEYQRIAAPAGALPSKHVVKSKWLRPREARLIDSLKPICNGETKRAHCYVSEVMVRQAIEAVIEESVKSLDDVASSALPLSRTLLPFVSTVTLETVGKQEAGESTVGEARFRIALSQEGTAFVAGFLRDCPSGLVPSFTSVAPQLRVHRKVGARQCLLVLEARASGVLYCQTVASVEACKEIGVEAEPCSLKERVMAARFHMDPAVQPPAMLVAVVGAATQRIMSIRV